ncbi:glycosyltransferase [Pseudophaeobacter sp.]|uniref:glycosyltransferase n=1 Tax=Pseudophaeobacter sp. TaxID=1971739 RepID=UPI004058BAC2
MPPSGSRPLISVIIPIFDVENHVAACIESLKAQSLTDFEALLIDDGATDNSAAVAWDTVAGDPRFQMIHQDNQGLSGARNTGLDIAQGAFVAFVDSDDRITPDYLMRLWQVLESTGSDWVACGIRFCMPEGDGHDHSAIHGQAHLHSSGDINRCPLENWNDIISHFPSAWNKLYRRELIEGLRFPEGTWFEDHSFYYQVARRTDHLQHLAAPLYLQTRDRAGQITGSDSDRVFEQFSVLDDMQSLMATSDRPGGTEAFEKIASRLLFERSTALCQPERRARYAQACARYLAEHGLNYAPDWDPHISRAWGLEMAGALPLSVVLLWAGRDPDLLSGSLRALARQGAPGREILIPCNSQTDADAAASVAKDHPQVRIVRSSGRELGTACNAGLEAAQGVFINFLIAGDTLAEMALNDWVDGLIAAEADFCVSLFRLGLQSESYHTSFHFNETRSTDALAASAFVFSPDVAIALDGEISPKLYRRSFLIETGIRFGPGALPGWQVALQAALSARKAIYLQWAGCDVNQSAAAMSQFPLGNFATPLSRSLDHLAKNLDAPQSASLPKGWHRRLFARALRLQISQLSQPFRALKQGLISLTAAWAAFRRGLTKERTPLDPGEGERLETLLSLEALLRRTR